MIFSAFVTCGLDAILHAHDQAHSADALGSQGVSKVILGARHRRLRVNMGFGTVEGDTKGDQVKAVPFPTNT